MKKVLIVIVILLGILFVAGMYVYKKTIPKMAASAIVKGEYSPIIPDKIQEKIEVVRDTINSRVEEVIDVASSTGITIEQLIEGIDEVDKKEVLATYNQVESNNLTKPEKVFDTAYKHIEIEAFDPIILKASFLENIKEDQVLRIRGFIKQNNIIENLDMEMARNIAKQILYQKQEEILKRTDVVEY